MGARTRTGQRMPLERSWRRAVLSMAVVGLAVAAAAGGTASGATSNSTVSVTVSSASWIDAAGCATGLPNITDFGTVLPGTANVTSSDCAVKFGSTNDTAMLRAYQQDGAGVALSAMVGAADATWSGGDSVTTVNVGNTDYATSSHVLPDGDIILAGYRNDTLAMVATRLNADGSLDVGYGGGDGISDYVDLGGGSDATYSSVLVAGNKLVIVAIAGGGQDIYTIRYDSNGSLDLSYGGGDGIGGPLNVGGWDMPRAARLLAGDKLLVVGTTGAVARDVFAVQLNADGTVDTGYGGGDGISDIVNVGGNDNAWS